MNFNTKPYSKKIDKPWGYEIKFTPEGFEHTGKVLFIENGKRFSFQYHDEKEEVLYLFSGKAKIWIENDQEEIEKKPMEINKGYIIAVGQKHRVEAIEDSFIFEVSGPEAGRTYRLEDDYQRDDEEK
jgi:mannose-6-phosphate isomerase-like protein (cupin superfamily)